MSIFLDLLGVPPLVHEDFRGALGKAGGPGEAALAPAAAAPGKLGADSCYHDSPRPSAPVLVAGTKG